MPIVHSLARPVYFLLFYVIRFRRKIAEQNIRNSFPDLNDSQRTALAKQHYRNFSQVSLEVFKSINMQPSTMIKHVTFTNAEILEEPLKREQTIIVSLAHHCNQVWAILAASQVLNFPIDGIYKPLHLKWLNELTIELLARFNITPIPAKTCITDLIKRSKQTRIIAIAPDQAPRRRDKAYWTEFMHQETPFYLGLENIAKLFKYPVYFMQLERTARGKYQATFKLLTEPPYDKDSSHISKEFIAALEEQTRKHPQDWLWIHRRWKKKKSLYD